MDPVVPPAKKSRNESKPHRWTLEEVIDIR